MSTRRGQMEPPLTASASGAASLPTAQTEQLLDRDVKEDLYSMELARRAVARAAIHLGIESMSERTLDVLADVLLSYLSRTGSALSSLVESSGRTSAHANVLDALQASEMVSAPAVQRVYVSSSMTVADVSTAAAAAVAATSNVSPAGKDEAGSTKMGESIANKSESTNTAGPLTKIDGVGHNTGSSSQGMMTATSSADWKGLASFLFGPNWYEESTRSGQNSTTNGKGTGSEKAPGDDSNSQDQRKDQAGGGKAGPSSTEDDKMDVDKATETNESTVSGAMKTNDDGDGDGAEHGDISSGGRGVGGKALAVTGSPEEETGTADAVSRVLQGWNAPFFDEVPTYPQASETCANPHALPARIGLSLHRKVDITEEEADEEEIITKKALEFVPDSIFGTSDMIRRSDDVDGPTSWGHLKRKKADDNTDDQDVDMLGDDSVRPTKRVKINEPKGVKAIVDENETDPSSLGAGTSKEIDDLSKFAFVPSFYPRPPPTDRIMDRGRTVVDLSEAERHQRQKMLLKSASAAAVKSNPMADRTEQEADDVRSSLVQLDQYQYWGSNWDDISQNNNTSDMVVPVGRPQSVSRTDGSAPPAGTAPGQGQAADVPIVPINRASLSTVSRILEGSVDAATM